MANDPAAAGVEKVSRPPAPGAAPLTAAITTRTAMANDPATLGVVTAAQPTARAETARKPTAPGARTAVRPVDDNRTGPETGPGR